MDQDLKFMVFNAVWAVFTIGSVILFRKKMDPKFKRSLIIKLNIVLPILFCIFIFWTTGNLKASIITIPIVAIISFCNIRIMQVCGLCSAVQMDQMQLFSAAKGFCRKCGVKIE